MGWSNLIFGALALHNVVMAHFNFVNAVANFVEPNTPTNIITDDTILKQYSINKGLQAFGDNGEASVQKYLQ